MNSYHEIWSKLPFEEIDPRILEERKEIWLETARKALELMPSGNVAIVADTSAGKTIIALLCALAKKHCVFLAPTKVLVYQHSALFRKISGRDDVLTLTGEISRQERIWGEPKWGITFSTPQTFLRDYERHKINPEDFDLFIFDEFDMASGKYPYVPISELVSDRHIPSLYLAASLGSGKERVAELKKNCSIACTLTPRIPTAYKSRESVFVQRGSFLRKADEILFNMLISIAKEISDYGFKASAARIMTERELKALRWNIESHERDDFFFKAISAHARYYKILHSYRALLTESYHTFLKHVERMENDDTVAARSIMENRDFRQMVAWVKEESSRSLHPKVEAYLEKAKSFSQDRLTVITFVAEKETGLYLKKELNQVGIRAENIFGGKPKLQNETLERLRQGELDMVVATTVIERGVNVPEVGVVVHYSMPLTAVSRIQRGGRTGRVEAGHIVFLCLDHPLDKAFYFATAERQERMENRPPLTKLLKKPVRFRPRTRKDKGFGTLDLFPNLVSRGSPF